MGFDFKRRFIYQHSTLAFLFDQDMLILIYHLLEDNQIRTQKMNLRSNFWIEREKRIQGDLHELEVLLLTSQTREQAVASRDHALIDINQFHFRRSERTNQKVLNQLILCCSKSGKLVGVLNERAGCQY